MADEDERAMFALALRQGVVDFVRLGTAIVLAVGLLLLLYHVCRA